MTPLPWLLLAVFALTTALALLFERLLRRRKEVRAYLRGVRYVLSDDPDAAIALLSDAAQLGSPEAVETYLALGALFRRTGDLVRAIRLHRNMLLRPGLDPGRRVEVERELAHDYRRAGMLPEALEAYRVLADGGDRPALAGLRDVFVELGRLSEAVEAQRALHGGSSDPHLAHLLAAQARAALASDPAEAQRAAQAAVEAAPASADALLARAEVAGAAGRRADALADLGAALDADPRSALLAGPAVAAVADPTAALAAVQARLAARPEDAGLLWLRGVALQGAGREEEALASFRAALDRDVTGEATLAVRDFVREAGSPSPEALAERHELLLAALERRVKPFICGRCGAEAPTRPWRCARCGAFDSYVAPAAGAEAPVP